MLSAIRSALFEARHDGVRLNDALFAPPQILIVAGFSGAGKSTFIEQLRGHDLPYGVTDWLPSGSESWPEVSSNGLTEATFDEDLAGATIHLDLLQSLRNGARSLSDDTFLTRLLTEGRVTVVNLIVARGILHERLRLRQDAAHRSKGALHRLRRRMLHGPLRRLAYRHGFASIPHAIDLYRSDVSRFEQLAAEWSAMLKTAASLNGALRLVQLRPAGLGSISVGANGCGWELVSAHNPGARETNVPVLQHA